VNSNSEKGEGLGEARGFSERFAAIPERLGEVGQVSVISNIMLRFKFPLRL